MTRVEFCSTGRLFDVCKRHPGPSIVAAVRPKTKPQRLGPHADPKALRQAREASRLALCLTSQNPALVAIAAGMLTAARSTHDTPEAVAEHLGVSRASYYRLVRLARKHAPYFERGKQT